MFLALLNTSIITAFGEYEYSPCTLERARELVFQASADAANEEMGLRDGWMSYIGHESTAQIMSELLGVTVFVNRSSYVQQPHDVALIFKLKSRGPEGRILTRQEIEDIGYEFGVLTRIR